VEDRLDKPSRKDKLHAWRSQQRAAACAKLPLLDEQMRAVFDMLDTALTASGCNHTLRFVREWTEQHGVPFDSLEAWFHENGGNCEVLANCEERWQDARHEAT